MKNVMTRAWEIVRENGLKIKFALVQAWKEAKSKTNSINFEDVKSLRVWENYGKQEFT